jgi:hypothetical protein
MDAPGASDAPVQAAELPSRRERRGDTAPGALASVVRIGCSSGMELSAPTLDEIRAARTRIAGHAVRTPVVRLGADAPAAIYLKLENLQPIGSFKLRGATNAMAVASDAELARGVYTASAGNMAQGVAWCARARGIPCSVIVPDTAPEAKRAAIARLGASIHEVPFAEWWDVLVTRSHPRFAEQLFIG